MRMSPWFGIVLTVLLGTGQAYATKPPKLRSESVVVRAVDTGDILISKNADVVRPIASITKLLSGLVLYRFGATHTSSVSQNYVTICEDDKDRLKWSRSRLPVGFAVTRPDLLTAGLGASENRAMYALVRAAGFQRSQFVEKMNQLASELGMNKSRFMDPAGIDPGNVSTAMDLLHLVDAASTCDDVRKNTLQPIVRLVGANQRELLLHNPNRLAGSKNWELVVGKTGYTIEAGRGLVIRTKLENKIYDMIFLGAREMASVFGDAKRVKDWISSLPIRTAQKDSL